MEVTLKKIEANQRNGLKGGVKTEIGKSISSQNSTKHGIFSRFNTSFDDISFEESYQLFAKRFKDEDPVRKILIEQLSVTYVRILRCVRFEAEALRAKINPPQYDVKEVKPERGFSAFDLDLFDVPKYESVLVKEGETATLPADFYSHLEAVTLKYEPMLWNRFLKLVELLER